jgi:hypothetical protein
MPEPRLHHLERQLESAIDPAIDAPAGVEVPEAVEAGIFGLAIAVDDASDSLGRMKAALNDIGIVFDAAAALSNAHARWVAEPAMPEPPWERRASGQRWQKPRARSPSSWETSFGG